MSQRTRENGGGQCNAYRMACCFVWLLAWCAACMIHMDIFHHAWWVMWFTLAALVCRAFACPSRESIPPAWRGVRCIVRNAVVPLLRRNGLYSRKRGRLLALAIPAVGSQLQGAVALLRDLPWQVGAAATGRQARLGAVRRSFSNSFLLAVLIFMCDRYLERPNERYSTTRRVGGLEEVWC